MKLTEEELKQLNRQRIVRASREQSECPGDDLLFRAAAKELNQQERQRVINHLRTCPNCVREYRIAHSTKRWAATVAHQMPQTPGSGRRGGLTDLLGAFWQRILPTARLRTAAVAAAVVVAIGVSLIIWRVMRPGDRPVPIERGGSNLVMKVEPTDKAMLEEAPRQLEWSKVESADSYQVVIYDFQLTPIWESGQMTGTSVEIQESLRAGFARGRAIYWRIFISSGIQRRQSALFEFRIAAAANN